MFVRRINENHSWHTYARNVFNRSRRGAIGTAGAIRLRVTVDRTIYFTTSTAPKRVSVRMPPS